MFINAICVSVDVFSENVDQNVDPPFPFYFYFYFKQC